MQNHSWPPPRHFVTRRWWTLLILVLGLAVASPLRAAEPAPETKPAPPADGLPVILLTGFEPFGPTRPPNSSWEGVKSLDGRTLRGHRLVARQLPVEWGQPLEQIGRWVEEVRPVAIFSFGQGLPGAFAIESRAAGNRRGNIPDNKQQRPVQPTIVADGPNELLASNDCQRLAELLKQKSHAVRVSKDAGAYLCEECLYSLEYLKSKQTRELQVLFCHVPPLDSQKVTPEFVQAFVLDLLAAWLTMQADDSGGESEKPAKPVKEDARTADVRKFIDRYFRTWSTRDMDGYSEGFLREAVVQHLDERGQVTTQATPDFLADQRRYQSVRPAREIPLAADIRFEGALARAIVQWKLEDGSGTAKYGYDHFTLVRRDGKWRILNLVFYGSEPPKNK